MLKYPPKTIPHRSGYNNALELLNQRSADSATSRKSLKDKRGPWMRSYQRTPSSTKRMSLMVSGDFTPWRAAVRAAVSSRLTDLVIGSGFCVGLKSFVAGVLFSHAFSGELQAVSVVNEAIEDGVAERWLRTTTPN
jgi:hypothetical protein